MCFSFLVARAQKRSEDVYVDSDGVMRWGQSRKEVCAFGINYTAMFAHAYRTAKKSGISLKQAIDDDIYHFARLGFDAFRVHVWDTEISDSAGNLLMNDHLRLFDYAISKMKARGMKFVITPIAYWGNGWPEPDENTPGFSRKYGKDKCLTDPGAAAAQERYLSQFVSHVNEYTGIAYKDDPDVIAFEISNEPHHHETPEKVTAFINRMVASIRRTRCKKPVFYNISHSIHLADAYFNADIQGGTFQWYPTGLGAGRELRGNFLPHVDRYTIPFAGHPKFRKMAKLVYEFDAADIGRSYIYPAMARSFREAGMQVATHFAYDPMFMADVNTEYGTHYMNLAYAPGKALGLMIASEAFHETPLYKDHGRYPSNTTFGNFRIHYESDLAEMISETKFLYSNHTASVPPAPEKLMKIAGYGNSPVIEYNGTGAYFLDRIKEGVWRLEVMPDAVWLRDPFEKPSPKKKVAAVIWKERPLTVRLPDLGSAFTVRGINDGNMFSGQAAEGSFPVFPGTYLLVRNGVEAAISRDQTWNRIVLKEFAAPKASLDTLAIRHHPADYVFSGESHHLDAAIFSADSIDDVEVHAWFAGAKPQVFPMSRSGAYRYRAIISGDRIKNGLMRYAIVVKQHGVSYTYPSGSKTHPYDWDFYDQDFYVTPILSSSDPFVLFNATTDEGHLLRPWISNALLKPSWLPPQSELEFNLERIPAGGDAQGEAAPTHDYSMRLFVGNRVKGREERISRMRKIIFRGRSLNDKPCPVQVALVTKDGAALGGMAVLHPKKDDYEVAIAGLQPVTLVNLPRPYPAFLPYFFQGSASFSMEDVEVLQISIGPGIPADAVARPHGIAIESIRLE